jgi:hypothetical protein
VHLGAGASFSHKGLVEICGVNSGLGDEFPKADFLAGLFGFGEGFSGLLLFLLENVDCGFEYGDGFRGGGDLTANQTGDLAECIPGWFVN